MTRLPYTPTPIQGRMTPHPWLFEYLWWYTCQGRTGSLMDTLDAYEQLLEGDCYEVELRDSVGDVGAPVENDTHVVHDENSGGVPAS